MKPYTGLNASFFFDAKCKTFAQRYLPWNSEFLGEYGADKTANANAKLDAYIRSLGIHPGFVPPSTSGKFDRSDIHFLGCPVAGRLKDGTPVVCITLTAHLPIDIFGKAFHELTDDDILEIPPEKLKLVKTPVYR